MKQAATAILLIALSTPVLADKGYCADIAGIAHTIMEVRQNGTAMSKLFEVVGEDTILKVIIVNAYESRRYV